VQKNSISLASIIFYSSSHFLGGMAQSITVTSSWKRLAVVVVVIEILGTGLFFYWQSQTNEGNASQGASPGQSSGQFSQSSSSSAPSDSLSSMPTVSVLVETVRTDTIVSETQGRVVKMLAEQGMRLQAGAPIATVDAMLKESTLKLAKATYSKAQKDYERFVQLHNERTATAVELEQYKLSLANAEYQLAVAQRQLDDATIRTPIAGVLTERMITHGSMIQPGMAVATVLDMAMMKIKAQVSEQDAFRMNVGQAVTIRTDVYPTAQLQGTIKFLSLKADQARTYSVEIHCINSPQHPLKAGQHVRIQYKLPVRYALTIPRSALVGTSTERSVYVLEQHTNMIPVKRVVTIGESIGAAVEIIGGLHAGETIIVSGSQTLRQNTRVSIQGQ
jgi:membrane fusion protein, multidrug efflux system